MGKRPDPARSARRARLVAATLALFAYMPAMGQSTAAPAAPLSVWLEAIADSAVSLAAGDPAGAEVAARRALVARPQGEAAARADLALGLALRESGRPAEAVAALTRAVPHLDGTTLVAAGRYRLGEALMSAGRPGDALPLFTQATVDAPPAMARRAAWRRADALLASGASRAAADTYRRLLSLHPADGEALRARLSLANALRATGDNAGAVATWRALWIEHPADPSGRAADEALRALRQAGGPVPPPSDEDRLARAARFLELAMPSGALETLDPLRTATASTAARATLLRAFALLQLGRREEAAARARPLTRDAEDGIRAGATLVLARAAARARKPEEAAATYLELSLMRERLLVPGLTPSQSRALPDDAAYLAAWLFYDSGDYLRAADRLRAYARARPRSPHALDARWFEAWSLVRAGRKEDGRRALEGLTRGPLQEQALYWLARLTRNPRVASSLYRRVLHVSPPGGWYALLASARLAARGERPRPYPATTRTDSPFAPFSTRKRPPTRVREDVRSRSASRRETESGPGQGEAGNRLDAASRLAGVGLAADALSELRALADGEGGRALAARIAGLADALGDPELPFRMARDHLAATPRALRWLYPLAFPTLLEAAAQQAKVDPLLYRSVMRRESSFRRDARSQAGAIGLVQLIPPTAERLGSVHGLDAGRVRELTSPEVSIALGAAYLSLLADRFIEPCVVIAAYNAGPAAVAGWARDGAGTPLDEWVEDIPFRETRRYVKAVVADWAVYRALRRGAPLSIDGSRKIPAPRQGVAF